MSASLPSTAKSRFNSWLSEGAPLGDLPHACNCIGPQNGDPVCPCQMRSVSIRNGRYVRVIDLGAAPSRDDGNSD